MPESWLLSVDIGVRNLGIALLLLPGRADAPAELVDTRVLDTGKAADATDAIRLVLLAMEALMSDASAPYRQLTEGGALPLDVVVENQPAYVNPRMRAVQAAVQAFFFLRLPAARQHLAAANSKTALAAEVILGRRGAKAKEVAKDYKGTKRATIVALTQLLATSGPRPPRPPETDATVVVEQTVVGEQTVIDRGGAVAAAIRAAKKRDDMCDAVMQGLSHAVTRGLCIVRNGHASRPCTPAP